MVKVKICGIVKDKDAHFAEGFGADILGFNFFKGSPRRISCKAAKEIVKGLRYSTKSVGVFVDEKLEKIAEIIDFCGIKLIQLHGGETPEFCAELKMKYPWIQVIKAFRIKKAVDFKQIYTFLAPQRVIDFILLDTHKKGIPGGTGKKFNWGLALKVKRYAPVILAGGLNPENVREAVSKIHPYAVDVASGVEKGGSKRGEKDYDKMSLFIRNAKSV
ncbi:N-(5'-phosphoribosyl)anthranilate isomerase [Candidatus Desantisbacteria bacterium CG_4_10_14_0_8_um_filter_48_22]|uniref:N-(5'-phosphoribosyl)anthranilate isomerase n=1 Tax=Candidatus Desantisbacteria bacterium CG_4_10_14_0_8_um_filter_48_22 TaxID=1974543 RepID=A0A2M7S727_9BACT|nr:MAG: hypothetical protein AUJ67_00460 [Candidatus Desantisbacteria bacterium CG1_02_49_89]PIV55463.1 MAG: N-(5'-phosphoribosyl)anthranilate isomerase [Candidatus Desantisbacteria bacterium CG02_land_8_20_14_3_00_49_13]PIZ15351.1 MAG: N-(5'-phosphoribosyl)anthranilate isomerase [Candidatus Desantisbacteria bacterium CG_4_10_14_0_8_um_filter_48_22]PJB28075.1 MAG: N-(5'-phosphoribosyl)anthranilate isomerase [Candidatus Desantisbacteria bacterium CG_4_9_14_3_um_filter_50_7]